MNSRGFMFSIEMLSVMSIIIVVVAAMASFSTEAINETNIFEIKNSNKAMIALYQTSGESIVGLANEYVLCRDIADYDYDLNRIVKLRQCGWN